MSRTLRKYPKEYFILNGEKYFYSEVDYKSETLRKSKELYAEYIKADVTSKNDYSSLSRDEKPYYKPPKSVKDIRKGKEKAKSKDAIRNGRDPDVLPKTDVYDYN